MKSHLQKKNKRIKIHRHNHVKIIRKGERNLTPL